MKFSWVSGRRRTLILLACTALTFTGCVRSPEEKSARYMESGKKLLQKNDAVRAILDFRSAAQATPKNPEVYYQLGTAYVAAGDWGKGVASLRRAVELNPKHVAARLLIAKLMTYSDQPAILEEAQEKLQSLLRDAPENPEALQTLGLSELKLGQRDDAIEHLGSAMRGAPHDLMIAVHLAEAKLQNRDAKGAEEVLKKACENSPKSSNAVVILGRFYLSQNRGAEAEQQFQRALEIDSNNANALLNLATLQRQTGRKQEAERSFMRLAALPGKTYKAAYAIFLFEDRRRDQAVREFERLFKEDPTDRTLRTQLVAVYSAVNRQSDAEKVLAQAFKKNPKDLDALLQQGELSLYAGRYDQAQEDLNKVLSAQPNSAQIHYIRAHLYQARGQSLTYRQELSEALRLDPYLLAARLEFAHALNAGTDARTGLNILNQTPPSQRGALAVTVERNWALLALRDFPEMRKGIDQGLARARTPDLLVQDGLWKLSSGDIIGARTALEEALKVDPANLRALSALRASYAAGKQNAVGLAKVREYAAQQPKSAPLQEYLGFELMMNEDRQGARTAFAAAQEADPGNTMTRLPQAILDVADRKPEDAVVRLKAILAADGGNLEARLILGKILDHRGDHDAALAEFQKVVNKDGDNSEGLNNLAYLLAERDSQSNEALKFAQKARELAPDNPEYADTLGWILYRRGLYPSAIEQLGRAASHEGNPVWKYHLAMAYVKAGDLQRSRSMLAAALKVNPNLPEAKIAKEMVDANK
jgi:tetratricopeptide (TPR) repeat protein